MSEERVPTLAQVVADLQDTMLAHEEEFKAAAAGREALAQRLTFQEVERGKLSRLCTDGLRQLDSLQRAYLATVEVQGAAIDRTDQRLITAIERLESLERDRYAAEQLTTLHLRVAALEAKLTVHLEAIGQMAQEVERLEALRLKSTNNKNEKE